MSTRTICWINSCINILLIFNSGLTHGQVDVSIGVSGYSGTNSNIGLNAGTSTGNFYLDFSSNLKGGSNELEHYYNPGTKTENHLVIIFNAGYNFRIKRNWYLVPEIGLGRMSDIYIRNRNRYSYENHDYFINVGLVSKFFISEDIGFLIGGGYPELGKIALVYRLWDKPE
jgi:hypothetical protein